MRTDAPVHVWKHFLANIRLALLHALPILLIVMTAVPSFADHTACSDGLDNDQDGLIDYPKDTQCVSLEDDSEGSTGQGTFITISDGRETVKAGGSLIYQIGVISDRDDQQEVGVRFHLPHQTNFLSASHGGHVEGSYVIWDKVTVQKGTQRGLTVNLEVDPYAKDGLLIISKVEAAGESAVDTTRVSNTIVTQSPLKLSITDDHQTAEPRETLTYRVRVENIGKADRSFHLRVTMPVQLSFISADAGYEKASHTVEWRNQILAPNEEREYTFTAKIEDHLSGFFPIHTKAFILNTNERASDTTFVHIGPLEEDFGITVKADRKEVERGQNVSYDITITNRSTDLATNVNVVNALPPYTEFVSASEGGRYTGGNEVRWDAITISPKGRRMFRVTARVRSDAPIEYTLINSAEVRNHKAHATTDVVLHASNVPSRDDRDGRQSEDVLLRKTADRGEATPGDTISYTITVRNTTDRTLRDLEVADRLDAAYMTLVSGVTDAVRTGNRLTWTIDELAPNEVWQRTYSVLIAADVPSGVNLNNIVTVGGDDISSVSLTERVQTAELGVVSGLPETGAGMDQIFLGLSGLLGAAQVLLQRRKLFA
ncbi:DUF11 domain-containing protein [Candidatus Peregrinibacteria bacterium]|nr:DUF11 domain-containing protein [Candidatus Peregrinibacteria bacterium]